MTWNRWGHRLSSSMTTALVCALLFGSGCVDDASPANLDAGRSSDAGVRATDPLDSGAPVDGGDNNVDGGNNTVDGGNSTVDGGDGAVDGGTVDEISAAPLPAGTRVETDFFATSQVCADCHSNHASSTAMRDASGREVGPFDEWQATMMANAARDPVFRAVLSAEIARAPVASEALQEKCLSCHAPMAVRDAAMHDGASPLFADLIGDPTVGSLGLDGVSCTVCHQIQPDALGSDESFSGNFALGTDKIIFGPYAAPVGAAMQQRTGFTPTQGEHLTSSAHCGSCHTLTTHAFRADGSDIGEILEEQSPYLEWRNSVFNDEVAAPGPAAASCQSCHMPVEDDDGVALHTPIARRPNGTDFPAVAARSPYGRHVFVGGNTLVPALLRDEASLGAGASEAAFDAVIARARTQLEERTAALSLGAIVEEGGAWTIPVQVTNLAGHKLPTGYPSRRAFLRLRVLDGEGNTLFVSGDFDAQGHLLDGDGQLLAVERPGGGVEPHHDLIERSDQVQIYEPVMHDEGGARTSTLLAATGYVKDNRLLPEGYSDAHPDAARTAPVGVFGDETFTGGRDELTYRVQLDGTPARVEVELYYQVLGARFLADLASVDTAAVRALMEMLERADLSPVRVALAEASVP